jgi:hypothetical protein
MGVAGTILGVLQGAGNWTFVRDTLGLPVTSLSVQHVEIPKDAIDGCNHRGDKAKVKLEKLLGAVKKLHADQPLEALFCGIHPMAWHVTLQSDYGTLELHRDPLTVLFGYRRFFLYHHYCDAQWTFFSLDALDQTDYIEITSCCAISTPSSLRGIRTLSQDMDPGAFSDLTVQSVRDRNGVTI